VNVFFFFLVPFAFCTKCFASPNSADSNVSLHGWKIIQKEIYSSEETDDGDDSDMRLPKPATPFNDRSSELKKIKKPSETVFDVRNFHNTLDGSTQEQDLEATPDSF
jgi:hypothetical protein